MSFSNQRKLDGAFGHGLGKEITEATQLPFESRIKSGHSVFDNEVLADQISFCPDLSTAISFQVSYPNIVKRYVEYTLTAVPGTNNQTWYIEDNGKYMRPIIMPVDIQNPSGDLSFGFEVRLHRSDGSMIPPTLGRWNVIGYNGVVVFDAGFNPIEMGWGIPKISCFVYVGETLRTKLRDVLEGVTWQNPVLSISHNDPAILSPEENNRYIIGQFAMNQWAGKENQIAQYRDGQWIYYIPEKGWTTNVLDEFKDYSYNGDEWVPKTMGSSPQYEKTFTEIEWVGTGPYTLMVDATEHRQGSTKHITATLRKRIGPSLNRQVLCDITITDNGLISFTTNEYFAGSLNIGKIGGIGNTDLYNAKKSAIGFTLDSGSDLIQNGEKQPALIIPYDCVIKNWAINANAAGSVQVDIWRGVGFKPDNLSYSITGNIKPNLSSEEINFGNDLTNWEMELKEGDVLIFNIISANNISKLSLTLGVER